MDKRPWWVMDAERRRVVLAEGEPYPEITEHYWKFLIPSGIGDVDGKEHLYFVAGSEGRDVFPDELHARRALADALADERYEINQAIDENASIIFHMEDERCNYCGFAWDEHAVVNGEYGECPEAEDMPPEKQMAAKHFLA